MTEEQEEHMSTLAYFWETKGDLERYSSYEQARKSIEVDYPQYFDAWDRYKSARETMSSLFKDF